MIGRFKIQLLMNFTHFRYTSQKKYVCVKNLVSVHAKPLYRERGTTELLLDRKDEGDIVNVKTIPKNMSISCGLFIAHI